MSIQNILVENNLDLFCKDLTIDGDLIISDITIDNLTVNTNLDVIGTSTFTGVINAQNENILNRLEITPPALLDIRNGSFFTMSGNEQVMGSGKITFNSGSTVTSNLGSITTFNNTPTFNNNINVPDSFLYRNNTYTLTITYSGDLSTQNKDLRFYRMGKIVHVYVPNFSSTSLGNGAYTIDISSLTNYPIEITSPCVSLVPIKYSGITDSGLFLANHSNQKLELYGGSGVFGGGDSVTLFPGDGNDQGLSASTIISYIAEL